MKNEFIWGFMCQARRWCAINEVSGGQYTFTLKSEKEVGMKMKTSGHIKKVAMFSFGNVILLKGGDT